MWTTSLSCTSVKLPLMWWTRSARVEKPRGRRDEREGGEEPIRTFSEKRREAKGKKPRRKSVARMWRVATRS